jgi:Holliday junction resolvase
MDSEKAIEKRLAKKVEDRGGWTLKMLSTHVTGLPDRLCLLPGGIVFFVEVKTTKKKPSKIQLFIHRKLRLLGFNVHILDRLIDVEPIIKLNERN